MAGFLTLSVTIPQGYLIAQKLDDLRTRLIDGLIAQRCHSSGVLIEISAPHGCWPVLREDLARLLLSDELAPIVDKFQVDLRINDSNRLAASERVRFGCGAASEPEADASP
jgi:hypothetical protein